MLYELIAICRPGNLAEVRDIARTAGSLVLNNGGVVRGFTNWGPFLLPKPLHVHQATHSRGHYFIMRFDSSANTQHMVRRTLKLDPRMIRFGMVKMGSKLEEIADVPGKAEWKSDDSDRRGFADGLGGFAS
ncbi:hypothetical protein L228DRAFT_258136 [Xylona heveae TC161]|uniref:Small ribosomal subunit protein bS6m n=1 Tax=Xylona heveae (strain CBS 132557 / TC161) TaxID=1328760 RepID=A0A165JXL6_XYLHT|nr:hypothetical protein L228DRAFT_258136 [Xylona heveae TC161]KZF26753.1 hypothetical protein L228DRAFT_258136 [Xylona heveae TC161]